MAVPTVPGDGDPGRVLRGVLDVMGGVAIRADGRECVAFLQHLLAVHRRRVLLAFLGMAFSAGIRNAQAPVLALGTAFGIDVVGVVTVVAGCIRARLVLPAWPRMYGFHVVLDLLDHNSEPRVLPGLVLLLGGGPQILVALHT